MNGSSRGPSIISRSSLRPAESSLNELAHEESSQRPTPFLSYGKNTVFAIPVFCAQVTPQLDLIRGKISAR